MPPTSSKRLRAFVAARLWPFLAGLGSAAVMVLAFLLPALQDQWDRYQSRRVVQAYADLGDALLRQERYAASESAYDKALELSQGLRLDVEAKRLEARVGRMSTMRNWPDTIGADLEEVDFDFLLAMGGQDPAAKARTLHAYGRYLASKGDAARARDQLLQAIRLQEGNPALWLDLGNTYDQADRPDSAEWAYRKALLLNPDAPEAHFNLGLLLDEQGRRQEAVEEMRIAYRLAPDSATASLIDRIAAGGP